MFPGNQTKQELLEPSVLMINVSPCRSRLHARLGGRHLGDDSLYWRPIEMNVLFCFAHKPIGNSAIRKPTARARKNAIKRLLISFKGGTQLCPVPGRIHELDGNCGISWKGSSHTIWDRASGC